MLAIKFNKSRVIAHLALAVFSIAGCALAFLYDSSGTFSEALALGSGYVALLWLVLTLLIGPFNLWRKRRNPVNIDLRRDVGIWSGIMGILHVIFGFQIFNDGDILSYFFSKKSDGYTLPQADFFSLSNYTGLVATLILLVLLVTSNQLSLRWLKGKPWKFIQRFNYPLFALVIIHTFGYQVLQLRENIFTYSVIFLSMAVLITQLIGFIVVMGRAEDRDRKHETVVTPEKELARAKMARRQFLIVGGTAMLGGLTVGIFAGQSLFSGKQTKSGNAVAATLPQPENPASTTVPAPAATPTNGTGATTTNPTPANGRNRGNNRGSGTDSNPAPVTTTPPSAATTPPAAANSRSIVLASAASLAPGNAMKFTTPDTNESAFLIRETDGSVKAFSGICTHRPYNLVFDSGQQALVCDLHNVPFNIATGAPVRRPASRALKSFKVSLDNQGNIIYTRNA
jgi:sulfoxide reductase heme-binding subunit YedZ